ncbi:hypothetical protein FEM48_Zijuj04G0131700 [Ziziphus jujuba var. spinosa]|uniref:threonine--tRNA ligase n=1 Tax=Ziziphus jujuba var. spinosa TaxID=714518 RepID=A0A978VK30_ZIZJJ|nr:hypothetical protein FEM48_Zijuj04G0131700 [Ziziphus jujuba var. spinosa]
MNVLGCTNVTFDHVTITAPENSLNTDGIHIGRSTGINITNTNIKTGDDCISLGDGSKQITVVKTTCGPGHGISVGSLGKYPNEEPVEGVFIRNCTLTNTQNGVRIKTWPDSHFGTASDMHFKDIIMNNVGNPILIDQEYCPWNRCKLSVPSKVKLSKVSFKNIRGTSSTPVAVKLVCSGGPGGVPCQNIEIGDVNLAYTGPLGPVTSLTLNETQMFILQRMANSYSLFTSSAFLSTPLLKTSSLPSHFYSNLSRFVSPTPFNALFNNNRNGFSTSLAVATDSSSQIAVSTQNEKLNQTQNDKTDDFRKVVLPTNDSSDKLLRIRHSCAHVMAMAVQKIFPDAKVTIGPWIENGFYYDFDMGPLTDRDLKKIKKEMDRIIGRNLPLVREEVTRDEAQRRIMALNEPYKLEILDSIKEDPITIYHIGDEWWDLCAGPHVESTGKINRRAVELESVAGAYWRGDEKNQMLQRIYGTAWENEEQLKAYLHFKEEAKRRDHRRLGQDLDLFSIQNEAGGGLVFWHPKGAIVRHMIEDLWKKIHIERGYDMLYTPHVAKADLWQISGHLDFYKENMYDQMSIEDELYQLRPMNCPYHILIYKRKLHSYHDFPIRVAELGTVYRYELSGSLHGLFRVRGFTQDDAHIFCLSDQIKDEIRGVLDLTEEMLLQFGFSKYEVNLSTRPEKAVGGDDIWEKATSALKEALDDKGWSYQIDEGGGAFYGPKIDLKIEDALGRKWQCSTIQAIP